MIDTFSEPRVRFVWLRDIFPRVWRYVQVGKVISPPYTGVVDSLAGPGPLQ